MQSAVGGIYNSVSIYSTALLFYTGLQWGYSQTWEKVNFTRFSWEKSYVNVKTVFLSQRRLTDYFFRLILRIIEILLRMREMGPPKFENRWRPIFKVIFENLTQCIYHCTSLTFQKYLWYFRNLNVWQYPISTLFFG